MKFGVITDLRGRKPGLKARLPSYMKRDEKKIINETINWKKTNCPKCKELVVYPHNINKSREHVHMINKHNKKCGGVLFA